MKTLLRAAIAPVVFLIIWSVAAPAYRLPSIWKIAAATVEMIENDTYFHDILVSSFRGLSGFLIGFALGTIVGVGTGRFPRFFLVFGGLLLFLRWTPVLALLPLTIRIGGLGEGPKVFLVAWSCFFVSWAYSHVAVTKLNPAYSWWAKALGLGKWQRFAYVYAPAVSPALIGAARVALAIGLIVVVAAELGGTIQQGIFRDGLGYRISRAIETNRNDINVACIITFGAIGLTCDFLLFQFVKRILIPLTGIDFLRRSE